MSIIQAIVFGAVQGVTEFLPISSTAHLILLPWFLGWQDPGLTFDVALHLGTLVALLVYFRAEWIQLTASGLNLLRGRTKGPSARLVLFIILASIPGGIAGLLLEDYVEDTLRNPLVISATLIVLAIVLVIAERVGRRQSSIEDMSAADAFTIGCAQALALVPGVSRSGITITAALFRGMTRPAAARFSFFLSTPIIGAAVVLKLVDIAREGIPRADLPGLIAGIVTAGIVGYASIAFLLRYLATHNTFVFIYYRIALGILICVAYFLIPS
jgi:undecaprenyl-diphosphatase